MALPDTDVRDRPTATRMLFGTGAGNALEWFDWQIYATFAPFIAMQMFDPTDPVSALLATLAVFAVGFVARPVGGILFGLIADRRGRKFSLLLAVGLASVGSLVIGLLPTFSAVGAWASLLLLVARLVQGLAHGGEMPAAQTYLSESAPPSRRGLWASFIYVSGTSGILAATLVGALLATAMPESLMSAWGWRIPFIAAAILGLYTLVLRSRLEETEAFSEEQEAGTIADRDQGIWRQLAQNWRRLLTVIGLTLGNTVAFYVWAVTAPTYASTVLGMEKSTSLWAGVVGTVVFIVMLPVWGALSDRIGRRPVFLIGTLGVAIGFFPLSGLMTSEPWTLMVSMSVILFFMAAPMSIAPAMFSELLPTRIRTIGTALPYGLAVALFGGTAPYLQTWLSTIGSSAWFTAYAVVLLLVQAVVAFRIRETRGIALTGTITTS